MKPDPALSVITLSFRDPEGLKNTLASLEPLHRSGLAWEHVVIDSSPEQNDPVLQTLPSDWPLARRREPPKGIYPAMNAGIRAARGQVAWFLNGGDLLHDFEVLRRNLEELLANPALDLLCLGVRRIRDGRIRRNARPHRVFLWNLLGGCHLPHQGVLYRKNVFDRVGLFSEKYAIAGDYEHHLRVYRKGLSVRCSGELLADFVLGGASDRFDATLAEWKKAAQEQWGDAGGLHGAHRFFFALERARLKMVTRLRKHL